MKNCMFRIYFSFSPKTEKKKTTRSGPLSCRFGSTQEDLKEPMFWRDIRKKMAALSEIDELEFFESFLIQEISCRENSESVSLYKRM